MAPHRQRHLDIAVSLKKRTVVINDNDGDQAKMEGRSDAYQRTWPRIFRSCD
jgi:hypothetical protein